MPPVARTGKSRILCFRRRARPELLQHLILVVRRELFELDIAHCSNRPPGVATVTITSATASTERASGAFIYHVSFLVQETGGRTGATVTDIVVQLLKNGTIVGFSDFPASRLIQSTQLNAGGTIPY